MSSNPRQEYHQEYYLRNKERYQERARAWYQRNKETLAPKHAAYYLENRDRYLVNAAAYRKKPETKEMVNARRRERYATDAEYREYVKAEASAHKWSFTDEFTYEVLLDLRSQDCFYCGGVGGSVDHLVPRVKGGEDRLDNLVPSCQTCNSLKGSKDLIDFYTQHNKTT